MKTIKKMLTIVLVIICITTMFSIADHADVQAASASVKTLRVNKVYKLDLNGGAKEKVKIKVSSHKSKFVNEKIRFDIEDKFDEDLETENIINGIDVGDMSSIEDIAGAASEKDNMFIDAYGDDSLSIKNIAGSDLIDDSVDDEVTITSESSLKEDSVPEDDSEFSRDSLRLFAASAISRTQREAVDLVNGLVSSGWGSADNTPNYDGSEWVPNDLGEPQCVDIIAYYLDWLIGRHYRLNAYQYANLSLPDGLSYADTPQPGDIVVWGQSNISPNGHIGIVAETDGSRYWYVDTNGGGSYKDSSNYVHNAQATKRGPKSYTDRTAFIHPDFAPDVTITLNKAALSIEAGSSSKLKAAVDPADKAGSVTWSSSNKSVAKVTSKGKVTGVKAGTAVITATIGGVSASCAVTVTPAFSKTGKPDIKSASAKSNGVKISWKAYDGAAGYRVLISMNPKNGWKKLADTKSTTYLNKKAGSGQLFYYTVRAYKTKSGKKIWSKYNTKGVKGTWLKAVKAPKVKASANKITVSWKKIKGAKGYGIFRKTSGGKWKKIAALGAGKKKYADKKAKAGVAYYYAVKAYTKVTGKTVWSGFKSSKKIKIKPSFKTVYSNSTWETAKRTVNGAVFTSTYDTGTASHILRVTKNGVTKTISSLADGGAVISNGETVYYMTSGKSLYMQNISSGKNTYIAYLGGTGVYNIDLEGKFNNYIYYTKNSPEGSFWRINIKTKKTNNVSGKVVSVSSADFSSGKWFVLTDGTGAGYSYIGKYDPSANKFTFISKKPYRWITKGNCIYYIEYISTNTDTVDRTVSVKRYNLKTGARKTLVKKVKMKTWTQFTLTSKYFKYYDWNGNLRTRKW